MFKRFTDGYFALGLILGISLTVLVLVWGKPIYEFAYCQGTQECSNYAADYEGNNSPDGSLWHWDGKLISSGDTLAQWIMALLTIAAVILLWRTLSSANKTNIAAIKAANAATEANQIMRDEQRSWLDFTIRMKDFAITGGNKCSGSASMVIKNIGKSPAHNVTVEIVPNRIKYLNATPTNKITMGVSKATIFPATELEIGHIMFGANVHSDTPSIPQPVDLLVRVSYGTSESPAAGFRTAYQYEVRNGGQFAFREGDRADVDRGHDLRLEKDDSKTYVN
jgi:hypothetical protein